MLSFYNLFINTFPNFNLITYILEIEKNLRGCKTVLDIGCGDNSPLRLLQGDYQLVGMDGYKPSLDSSKSKVIHDRYVYCDIKNIQNKIKQKSFDAVVAFDVIEHLTKVDGYKLLENMEKIAKKRIILVTPNGFIIQHNYKNNLQEHLSGWSVQDFKKKGYKVKGLYGFKPILSLLRADDAGMKPLFKPKLLWSLIGGTLSEVTHHLFTKNHPEYSFSLLAYKKID